MPSQHRNRHRPRPGVGDPSASPQTPARRPPGGRVFVLGAGVDVPYRMPTMPSLLRHLAQFAAGEGKPVHLALKARLPHLMFKFDKYAADQSDTLLGELFGSADQELVATLRGASEKLQAAQESRAVGVMLTKLCDMAERNQLTGPDLLELARLGGDTVEADGIEPLLDPRRLTLSATPSRALRTTFQQALTRVEDFTEREREALEFFIIATSDIESLLALFFLRFLNGTQADKKNYLYLIWMLWAFLRSKSIGRPQLDNSLYATLASLGGHVITFNYTNFFDPITAKRVLYFHGRLDDYLRLDTRQLVRPDAFLGAITVNDISKLMKTLRLDVGDYPQLDIPSIVPPTSFKPVMSRQQLKTWAEADDMLQTAAQVVIVGYSFANADEHFNDLLRNLPAHTEVVVVNPDKLAPLQSICRILGVPTDSLKVAERGGLDVLTSERLRYVPIAGEALTAAVLS